MCALYCVASNVAEFLTEFMTNFQNISCIFSRDVLY